MAGLMDKSRDLRSDELNGAVDYETLMKELHEAYEEYDQSSGDSLAGVFDMPYLTHDVAKFVNRVVGGRIVIVGMNSGRTYYVWNGTHHELITENETEEKFTTAVVDALWTSLKSRIKKFEKTEWTGDDLKGPVQAYLSACTIATTKWKTTQWSNLQAHLRSKLQVSESAFTSNRFFAFDNGVLDTEQLMNGEDIEILPHDSSRFITDRNRIHTDYVDYDDVFDVNDFNSIGAPNLEKFVSGSFQNREDGVNLLRALGVALFSSSEKLKTVVVIYGNNNSGKSMVIRIMDELAGGMVSEGGADIFAVGKDKYAASDVEGQRIVVSSEMQDAAIDQEDVKKWSGGDKRRTLRKYKDSIEWKPEGMLFFVANSKTEVTDLFDLSDPAMKERAMYVHFPHTFGQSVQDEYVADKKIEARIKNEERAQFAYALLRLARDWVADGAEDRIPKTANQERIADKIEGATDPVQSYLNEGVQQGSWHVAKVETPVSHLLPFPVFWKAYQAWYEKAYDVKLKKNKILDQLRMDGMIEVQGTRQFVKNYTPNQTWAYVMEVGDISEETINGFSF